VSDPVSTARNARESLARGLSALQSDPSVPPQLLELAAPIAQSMGALHQIERSNGVTLQPHADVALNNVRAALAQLQAAPASHPAIATAMESVASSLGLVHQLSKLGGGGAQPQPAARQPQAAPQVFQPPPQQPQARPAPQPAQAYQQPPPQAYQPPPQPQHARQGPFQPAAAPPRQQGGFPAQGGYPAQQPQPQGRGGTGGMPGAPGPGGAMQVISADLGAHSPTNFYKGLSGNDIIDHGGLFVSTYMVPKIGTPVRLKVSLPGGYEFEANAVVRWSREQSDSGSDAPPGFGAQFTQITPEARQLVYRYVRNREPLFHDDL
jgi:uncharacterized protein (TIGR02266 family)